MAFPVKLAFIDFEKTVFTTLETESWPDTFFCLFAYFYITVLFLFFFISPLAFFAMVFLTSRY